MAEKAPVRILIVEDDFLVSEMIAGYLAEGGYEVVGRAPDGVRGVELTARLEPDLVLLDLQLPDQNGIETARAVQGARPTPVVVLTAFDCPERVVEASRVGVGAFLVKPTTARELDRAITVARARFADLAELRRLNAQLESEKAARAAILQTAVDGFWLVDPQARIVEANQAFADLMGYARDELAGMTVARIEAGGAEDAARRMDEVVRQGFSRFESRYRRKDGRVIDVETSATWLAGQSRLVAFTRDVTGRKRAEEERARLEAQLQHAMKMQAIGRLAGGVAHDFNNLLTGILGNLSMARMDLAPDSPLAEILDDAAHSAESAATLVRQLLAFSRKQLIEPRTVDLNGVVEKLRTMLDRLIGETLELRTELHEHPGPVKVDPSQIEQMLVNLVVNARDAMPSGGVLTIRTGQVEVGPEDRLRLAELPAGSYVTLAVTDTGEGMLDETKLHLFEPFFTTKPKGRGTGLGLATIYGAVKQAGGAVEVLSEPGKGSTFTILLPRADEEIEDEPVETPDESLPRGTETILLVEDEKSVRDLGVRILERLGYRVLQAPDGEHALEVAHARPERIDLLLTDVVMPGMDGAELAERMAGIHPETKVLFASGYTDSAIMRQGVVEKGVQFIAKPFTVEMVARKVREVLGRER